jgi:hypothetical protein
LQGTTRPVSLARRLVIDLMHASEPLVSIKRSMQLDRLASARATRTWRHSWATLIAKGYCIVARDEPRLRTFYLPLPWPRFYEARRSIAMLAVSRDDIEPDALVFQKLGPADELSLDFIEYRIRSAKAAPIKDLGSIARMLSIARWPWPVRRLIWGVALNLGRERANNFGTIALTSIASLGAETVVLRGPGPAAISYGLVKEDHTMELIFHWDHRIYDGILAARALRRLEEVMNSVIADEVLAGEADFPLDFEKPEAVAEAAHART